MTYKTHFIGGICATALASTVAPIENIAVVGAVSAVSALLPDIDIADSKVGRKVGVISKGISSIFGHRGFIHTPVLYIVLYIVLFPFLPMSVCEGFLIGTLSHLVLDSFNYKGIMWLYPFTKKHYHIASIKTRDIGESIFLVVMVVVSAVVFISSHNNVVMGLPSFDMPSLSVPKVEFYVENTDVIISWVASFFGKCKDFVVGMLTF